MVNVGNLRKRNFTGSTLASTDERNNILKIVEEISNKRSLTIPAEFTRREIPKFFADSENDGLKMDSFRLSLIDPISKLRIKIPAQSTKCNHFQCFDLYHFLEFSFKNNGEENKNAWLCPHCQAEAKQGQLRVDGYFQEILLKVGPEPLEVELLPDGNWRQVEQLDFKELLAENDDIVEIIPKKRVKISNVPNSVGNPQQLNSTSGVSPNKELDSNQNILEAFHELKRQMEASKATEIKLCEILGLNIQGEKVNGDNIIDTVRKLKQKATIIDRLHQILEISDDGTQNALLEKILALKKAAEAASHQSIEASNHHLNNCASPETATNGQVPIDQTASLLLIGGQGPKCRVKRARSKSIEEIASTTSESGASTTRSDSRNRNTLKKNSMGTLSSRSRSSSVDSSSRSNSSSDDSASTLNENNSSTSAKESKIDDGLDEQLLLNEPITIDGEDFDEKTAADAEDDEIEEVGGDRNLESTDRDDSYSPVPREQLDLLEPSSQNKFTKKFSNVEIFRRSFFEGRKAPSKKWPLRTELEEESILYRYLDEGLDNKEYDYIRRLLTDNSTDLFASFSRYGISVPYISPPLPPPPVILPNAIRLDGKEYYYADADLDGVVSHAGGSARTKGYYKNTPSTSSMNNALSWPPNK